MTMFELLDRTSCDQKMWVFDDNANWILDGTCYELRKMMMVDFQKRITVTEYHYIDNNSIMMVYIDYVWKNTEMED